MQNQARALSGVLNMHIVQITDIHLTHSEDMELYGVDTGATLEKVVNEIQQLSHPPEIIIATGDLSEDGSERTYLRLRHILGKLNTPVYVLPGNHDDFAQMQLSLNSDNFHCKQFAKIQGWGFIFLNSQVVGQSHGYISADQLSSLENHLCDHNDIPIMVALHHTPSDICPSFGCQLENKKEFFDILNGYKNVKAVIAGHTHNALAQPSNGYVQYTTPSTFAHVKHAQLGETEDHDDFWAAHQLDGNAQAFRSFELLPDGKLTSAVHWIENTT